MPDSNIPIVDLAAALDPVSLAPWISWQYAEHEAHVTALMERNAKFLDVTKDGITDDFIAGHSADFANELRGEATALDATRTKIKAPVLHAQRLIDGEAKKLTDRLTSAKATVEYRMTTYLQEKEVRARAEAKAEADRLAAEADAAIEAAQHDGGIHAQEVAVAAIQEAQTAASVAEAKPLELTRTRSQGGSLAGLRDNWVYTVEKLSDVPSHLLQINDAAVKLAIKQGTREIPGLKIWNDTKVGIR